MIDVKLINKVRTKSATSRNGISGGAANMLPEISATLQSLIDFNAALSGLLTPCDKTDNELSWLQAFQPDGAGGIKAKSLKAKVDFYSDGAISALGKSDMGDMGGGGGLVEGIYRWGDLGGTFSDTDNDTFNAYTLNRIYSELTAADSAISARLADYYTKSEADGRYALSSSLANYVKKAGDTMTGALAIQTGVDTKLIFNNTDGEKFTKISFREAGTEYGALVVSNNRYNLTSMPLEAPYFIAGGTTLCPNLNADMLDGYHASEFALGGKAYYLAGDGIGARWIRIATFSGAASGIITIENTWSYNLNSALIFSFAVGYRGNDHYSITQIGGTRAVFSKARIIYPTATNEPGFIEVYYNESAAGHNHLNVRLANAINATLIQTATSGSIPSTHAAYEQEFVGNGIAAVNIKATTFTGALAGNASSATKLQTLCTIWGQTFDGTRNVSGNMTGVGSITAGGTLTNTGDIVIQQAVNTYGSRLRFLESVNLQGAFIGYDGVNNILHIGVHEANDSSTSNDLNAVSILRSNGNVGIGTTSPTYRLDVNGTAKVTALRIGDVTISHDAVNGGLHVSGGGLYADTFISALGVNPNDGSVGGEGGGLSYDRLDAWADYTADKAGYVLSALLGHDLYQNKLGKTEAQSLYQPKGNYLTTHQALDYLNVKDVRGAERLPSYFWGRRASFWFNNIGMPGANSGWWSGLTVKGWTDSYQSWQIAGPSHDGDSNTSFYFRVGRNATWGAWQAVLTSANYSATLDSRYVKKSGDTMTGSLTVPTLNIVGSAASSSYITSDSATNVFVNVGGKSIMVWDSATTSVRPGSKVAGLPSLGLSNNRWSNVYANTINVSSAALVSNLNADMLDGRHADSFCGASKLTNTPMYNTGYYKIKIKSTSAWMLFFKVLAYQNYTADEINISGYNYGSNHWYKPSADLISSQGHKPKASINVVFGFDSDWNLWVAIPAGHYAGITITDVANGYNKVSDTNLFEIVYEETLTGTLQETVTATRHAKLTDNVASATRLQTNSTFTAWGRPFFANGVPKNIEGSIVGVGDIGARGSAYGNFHILRGRVTGEAMRIEPLDANGSWLTSGIIMYTDGNIKIGGSGRATHKLHVNGTARVSSLTLDGSHLLEWDEANEAWKFNGNLYATGSVSALGIKELSATEAEVDKLKANTITCPMLKLSGDDMQCFMLYSKPSLHLWFNGNAFMGNPQSASEGSDNTVTIYGGIKIGPQATYSIDCQGEAHLHSVAVRTSIAIKTAVFTVESNEIYVTISGTKYKLTKTAVS